MTKDIAFTLYWEDGQYLLTELLPGKETPVVVHASKDLASAREAVQTRLSAGQSLNFRAEGWEWFVTLDAQEEVLSISKPSPWSF